MTQTNRNTIVFFAILAYVLLAFLLARWTARPSPAPVPADEGIVREPQEQVFQLSGGKRSAFDTGFDRGANAAMDTTLEVLSDYRANHKNVDWLTLQREVARRLSVRRKEWFLARQ